MFTLFNYSRRPSFIVNINGIPVNSIIDLEWTNPSYYEAATFELNLAAGGLPFQITNDYMDFNQAFLVEIYGGLVEDGISNQEGFDLLFTGQIDQLEYDFKENTYFASGRDLAAKFIDNKTTEKFQNQTSSDIAIKFAKRRGLQTNVVATKTPVGYYYNIDHVQLETERTEWDILTYLAQKEQYLVYVSGQTLNFVPIPTEDQNIYPLIYAPPDPLNNSPVFTGMSFKAQRNLTIAKDVIVEVRSWNQKQKKGFTVKLKGQPNKKTYLSQKAQPIGDAQVYAFVVGGLTKEQALQYAQQKLNEISKHQLEIEVDMPADNILMQNSVIKVVGTNRVYDQSYYPSRVTRRVSFSEGYRMTIEAKNHSPITEVQI